MRRAIVSTIIVGVGLALTGCTGGDGADSNTGVVSASGDAGLIGYPDDPDTPLPADFDWSQVGDGWTITSVGYEQMDSSVDYSVQPATVLYLVSPGDDYYQVAELPEEWHGARVVSWAEGASIAYVQYLSEDGLLRGGQIDLVYGDVEELHFGTDEVQRFLAASSDGKDLWEVTFADGGVAYYVHSGMDSWSQVSIPGIEDDDDYGENSQGLISDLGTWGGLGGPLVSPGGTKVAILDRAALGDADGSSLTVYVYDLSANTIDTLGGTMTQWTEEYGSYSYAARWIDDDYLWVEMSNADDSERVSSYEVFAATIGDEYYGDVADDQASAWLYSSPYVTVSSWWSVGYGEVTDPAVTGIVG